MKEEEKAREYFLEMKEMFQLFQPNTWKTEFKILVDKLINRLLKEARHLMEACKDAYQEEEQHARLHSIRRLVAGAVQEWELTQQPNYARTCAEIDGALVWDGRGCVICHFPILSSSSIFPEFI